LLALDTEAARRLCFCVVFQADGVGGRQFLQPLRPDRFRVVFAGLLKAVLLGAGTKR